MQYSKNNKLKEIEKSQIFGNDINDKNELPLTVKNSLNSGELVNWLFEKFINAGNFPNFTQEDFLLYCKYKENDDLNNLIAKDCKEKSFSIRLLLDFRTILVLFAIHAINMFFYMTENMFLLTIAGGLLCLISTAFLLFKFDCLCKHYTFKKSQEDFNEMYAYYNEIKHQNFMNLNDLNFLLSPPGEFKWKI